MRALFFSFIAITFAVAGCVPRRSRVAQPAAVAASASVVTPTGPQLQFRASAPAGMLATELGTPRDLHFHSYAGPGGTTLFPNATVTKVPVQQFAFDVLVLEDSLSLEAHLSAWSVVSASFGAANDTRFGTYRAYYIDHAVVLDDRTASRAAPPGAVFYPHKIYYGHAYEAVFSGSTSKFHAGVAAKFKVVSGAVKAYAASSRLSFRVVGQGLAPVADDALFVKSVDEVKEKFTLAGAAPVPILVEYRTIPGGSKPEGQPIPFVKPIHVTVGYPKLHVVNDGTWGSTPWTMRAFCEIDGEEVSIPNPIFLNDQRVKDGHVYDVGWSAQFDAAPGSSVACGASGFYHDSATAPTHLPRAKMFPTPAVVGEQTGEIAANDAKASYKVRYTMVGTP